jgi:hypothetical protein
MPGLEGYTQILADYPRFPKVLSLFLRRWRFRRRSGRRVCKQDGQSRFELCPVRKRRLRLAALERRVSSG